MRVNFWRSLYREIDDLRSSLVTNQLERKLTDERKLFHLEMLPFWNQFSYAHHSSLLVSCSHGRSYQYYADSILHPHSFKAFQCDNWEAFKNKSCKYHRTVYMGDETPSTWVRLWFTIIRFIINVGISILRWSVTELEEFIICWLVQVHHTDCRFKKPITEINILKI